MSPEFAKWDEDGRFGLARRPGGAYEPWNDDLGRGDGFSIMHFGSAEAREYFIQAENARYAQNVAIHDLECLKTALRECITPGGRIRRAKLAGLIEGLK